MRPSSNFQQRRPGPAAPARETQSVAHSEVCSTAAVGGTTPWPYASRDAPADPIDKTDSLRWQVHQKGSDMTFWVELLKPQVNSSASLSDNDGAAPVADSCDFSSEYRMLAHGPALADRADRALLSVRGADRATWLHNLTTNHVRTVSPSEGNYAFVLNLQGRILFDLAVLVRREEILLDLDRGFLDLARRHFDKYIISEDVRVEAFADRVERMALLGPRVRDLLSAAGMPQTANLALWSHLDVTLGSVPVTLFRHDYHGDLAIDMIVPADRAIELARWLTDASRPVPARLVGANAVHVRRIEAGIPWPGHEISNEYLPAETGQTQRAVSYNKGCYLGQEVVERMRSRGVVARRLCGLLIEPGDLPLVPAPVSDESGQTIGTVTSVCHSPARAELVALGYVRTAAFSAGKNITIRPPGGATISPRTARLVELPFA